MVLLTTTFPAVVTAQEPVTSRPSSHTSRGGYARFGGGAAVAQDARDGIAIGFGYRHDRGRLRLDVSVFNYVFDTSPTSDPRSDVLAGSHLKLAAFRILPAGQSEAVYVGGGVSWGVVRVGRNHVGPRAPGSLAPLTFLGPWRGGGLQGDLTAGYEMGRTRNRRVFIQGDASLPMFSTRAETIVYEPAAIGFVITRRNESRYIPSAVLSLGISWSQ